MEEEKVREVFASCYTKSDVCRQLGFPTNGTGMRKVNSLAEELDISTEHFDPHYKSKQRKYPKIEKECPVCKEIFVASKGSPKEKTVCTRACANTYFRSGPDNGRWSDDSYRSTCFHYHDKECVVCGEHRIVAVHHYDEDRTNNSPENLIPICPTHHEYVHSKYSHLVEDQIEKYRDKFIENLED